MIDTCDNLFINSFGRIVCEVVDYGGRCPFPMRICDYKMKKSRGERSSRKGHASEDVIK